MPFAFFWIEGRPVPQPRYAQGDSKTGKRQAWIPRVKDPLTKRMVPHPIHAWRELVALRVLCAATPEWPVKGPVALSLLFWTHGGGDLDNLAKGVKDALKGILYVDDKQVREYREPFRIEQPGIHSRGEGLEMVVWW